MFSQFRTNQSRYGFPFSRFGFCIGILSLLLSSCYIPKLQKVDIQMEGRGLAFLQVGQTSKTAVQETLGPSAIEMQKSRILMYRLLQRENGAFIPISREEDQSPHADEPQWNKAQYSLILVFTDYDVLKAFQLLKVR